MSAQRACFLSQTLMDRETERRHNTASQKNCTSMNYTAKLQPRIGSYGHIRPAPWQRARHSPGTPHACHRWKRLGFSHQLAHGRHHTSTSLDRHQTGCLYTQHSNCNSMLSTANLSANSVADKNFVSTSAGLDLPSTLTTLTLPSPTSR